MLTVLISHAKGVQISKKNKPINDMEYYMITGNTQFNIY